MTTGSEPGPEMFVVVTVKVAAVRLQHARVITEHRRQENLVFIVVSFRRNHEPGQKRRGANLIAPSSKAPRSAHAESTPSRARLSACSVGFCIEKFAVFREDRSRATLNMFQSFLFYVVSV